jgi:hypothetical protein
MDVPCEFWDLVGDHLRGLEDTYTYITTISILV